MAWVFAATLVARAGWAQSNDDEAATRERYGFTRWAAPSGPWSGVDVSRIAPPGLVLRARTDHLVDDGGIVLAFGPAGRTTLTVRVAVAPDAGSARNFLLGHLRSAQATLVPLGDALGSDAAFGDDAAGTHAAGAVYGNVAVWIARTVDAGSETPSAASVLAVVRGAVGARGAMTLPAPTLAPTVVPGSSHVFHVNVGGGSFAHVEARVRGGHLRGPVDPTGFDVVAGARSAVDVRVVATDALGRSASASMQLPATPLTGAR